MSETAISPSPPLASAIAISNTMRNILAIGAHLPRDLELNL